MNRKALVLLVSVAILATAAYFLLNKVGFDWSLFFRSFRNVSPVWLGLSVVATLSTYFIRAVRWRLLLEPVRKISITSLLSATFVGFGAIYVFGRAGELVRPIWIARRHSVPLPPSIATIIVERILDTLWLINLFAGALLTVALPVSSNASLTMMKSAAGILLGISLTAFVIFFVFRLKIDTIVANLPFPRLAEMVHSFAQGMTFIGHWKSFSLSMAWSAALWVIIALQFWLLLAGLSFDFTIAEATFIMVATALGSIAQIPGIGGGFQAGYVFCLTTFFTVPAETAFATSLVAWAFSYVPTVAVAALYLLHEGLSWRSLKEAFTKEAYTTE